MSSIIPRRQVKPRAVTDWDAARRALEAARTSVEERRSVDPLAIERELQQRAAALAVAGKLAKSVEVEVELICFVLGTQRCALETSFVVEVRRPCEVTRLPGTPRHWLGVTNLRGEILPVFDLCDRLGLGSAASSESARMLVLGEAEAELVVHVDAVIEIVSVPLAALLGPAETSLTIGQDFIRGVTHDALVVLDAAGLLADPQLQIGTEDESNTRGGAGP